jgi:Putative adhesin
MNRTRNPWIAIGLPLLIVSVAATVFGAFDYLGRREETTTDPVGVLDIDSNGSIRIVGRKAGSTQDGITVERTSVYSFRRPTVTERMDGTTLVLRGDCRSIFASCSVGFTVTVPENTRVVARSSGGNIRVSALMADITASSSGGGISVEDSTGTMNLGSSGGGVRFDRVGGSVKASSSGDGVTGTEVRAQTLRASSSGGGVRISFATSPDEVTASSSGGGVQVLVPRTDDSYRVTASSSGGGRSVEVKTDPASTQTIKVTSSGGDVRVNYIDEADTGR